MPPYDLPARLRAALNHGDELTLASILHRDARMVADSGDDAGGELSGRARIIHAFDDLKRQHPDASFSTVHVNGQPGLSLRRRNGEVVAVLGIDGTTAIVRLWLCTSSLKLAGWNRRRPDID
ncbi:hypothetical protein GE115_11010 [Agromyces sp. CFH 90414]|uniref:Nuclear transport factor 2 family protein n=1 Tax=Agromyces agglutinans TaxID=2662258 RepID=A0A6I2F6Y7_9MICO|nr:hypothetical protein [Agromyces agglutinans]MRG60389.1 hypothetical protein [Agromyces agglutinans]